MTFGLHTSASSVIQESLILEESIDESANLTPDKGQGAAGSRSPNGEVTEIKKMTPQQATPDEKGDRQKKTVARNEMFSPLSPMNDDVVKARTAQPDLSPASTDGGSTPVKATATAAPYASPKAQSPPPAPGANAAPAPAPSAYISMVAPKTSHALERLGAKAATPVRSRLENLSQRLAENARVQAVEKRTRQSAIMTSLKEVQEKQTNLSEVADRLSKELSEGSYGKRIRDLEEKIKSLVDKGEEEKRARVAAEDKIRLAEERFNSEVSRMKRDAERMFEDEIHKFNQRIQEMERKLSNSTNHDVEINALVGRMSEKIITLEQHEVQTVQTLSEVKHMAVTEKTIREEMENTLMKMLDDLFGKLRWQIDEEKKTRESTEEAMLKILEDTLNRVELLE